MIRRPTLRDRLLSATHLPAGEDGAGATPDDGMPPADPPAADKAPAGDPPAGDKKPADAALGDDGMPLDLSDEPPPAADKPAKEEFKPDPAKSDEENATAKEAFEKEQALNSVPEGEYDFSAVLSEFGVTNVDENVVAIFNKDAKEAGLTQKQANAMAKVQIQANAAYMTKIAEVKKGWLDSSRADEEIGGTKWNQSVAAGRKVIAEFGDDELRQFFRETGIGAHPAILRCFAKIGKATGEGGVINGGDAATTQQKSAASVFYPDP